MPIAFGVMIFGWLLGRGLGAPPLAAIWMGWFAAAAVCVMREITQREYQWIENVGGGKRENMPVLEGLKIWDWNSHSLMETGVALILSALAALLLTTLR